MKARLKNLLEPSSRKLETHIRSNPDGSIDLENIYYLVRPDVRPAAPAHQVAAHHSTLLFLQETAGFLTPYEEFFQSREAHSLSFPLPKSGMLLIFPQVVLGSATITLRNAATCKKFNKEKEKLRRSNKKR